MTNADELESANIPEDALTGEKRLSEDVDVLQAEVAQMTLERDKLMQKIRDLREAEDPANRVYYHKEIFAAQQEKLRIDVDIKFRTNKINRINLGIDEAAASDGVKGGFLF